MGDAWCISLCFRSDTVDCDVTCPGLQEAAASAGENTERRMRGEMEQGREVVRKTEGSVSDLERRLEEALSQLKEKSAVVADLKTKLDEVQVYVFSFWVARGGGGTVISFFEKVLVRCLYCTVQLNVYCSAVVRAAAVLEVFVWASWGAASA